MQSILPVWCNESRKQGPVLLAVGADGAVWTFFSLLFILLLSTALYRLKYFPSKESLKPGQSTSQQSTRRNEFLKVGAR